MKRAKAAAKSAKTQSRRRSRLPRTLPFIEHIYELRKRLFYVALSVGIFSVAAYFVQQHIVAFLLKPAKAQQFIYTTPGGGIDFLFRVCLYVGIFFSIPVIVHQVLKYLEPLIRHDVIHFVRRGSIASGFLALAGMGFGYFVGMPAALHFLLNQFTTKQIEALLSIQAYMAFVTTYLLASAMLFQIPLILLLINRIKPLRPRKLLSYERWVIVIAVVLGGIINPSPNISDQLLLAGPMILTYQLGIVLVWLSNRRHRRPKLAMVMSEEDLKYQQERRARFQAAQTGWERRVIQAKLGTVAASTFEPPAAAAPAAITSPAPKPPQPAATRAAVTLPAAPALPKPAVSSAARTNVIPVRTSGQSVPLRVRTAARPPRPAIRRISFTDQDEGFSVPIQVIPAGS